MAAVTEKGGKEAKARPSGASLGLVQGFGTPFRALGYMLRHPSLWRFALLPVVVTGAILVGLVAVLFTFGQGITEWIWPRPEAWYWLLLWYPLHVLVLVSLFAIGALTLPGLISSPFNKALSRRTEQLETGNEARGGGVKAFFRGLPGALADELRKIAFLLGIHVLLLAMNFLPGVGQVLYPVLAWSWTVIWLSAQYLAFSLSRHARPFFDTPRTVRKNFLVCVGFGLGVFLFLLVPLLNFFFVPVAVIGGTLLYLDLERSGGLPPAKDPR